MSLNEFEDSFPKGRMTEIMLLSLGTSISMVFICITYNPKLYVKNDHRLLITDSIYLVTRTPPGRSVVQSAETNAAIIE